MHGLASRHYAKLRGATIAVAATVQWLLVRQGGFFLDDFRNLADARRLGLSVTLLKEPLFEHFAPGHRLMDWLAVEPLARSFGAATAVEALLGALSMLAFSEICRELWGK